MPSYANKRCESNYLEVSLISFFLVSEGFGLISWNIIAYKNTTRSTRARLMLLGNRNKTSDNLHEHSLMQANTIISLKHET